MEKKDQIKDQKKPILNLSLEALVTHGYQDKLKRDRVGIIFRRAKKSAWDSTEDSKLSSEEKNYTPLFLD